MERELWDAMSAEFEVRRISYLREADMNYVGQSHTVRVSLPAQLSVGAARSAFEKEYLTRYGHSNEGMEVAFVALRASGVVPTARPSLEAVKWVGEVDAEPGPSSHRQVYFAQAKARLTTPVYGRSDMPIEATIEGPAVVEEYSSTTVIGAGDRLVVGKLGELRITCAINRRTERSSHE
jgi:N-methylhydantoinase A